MFGFPNTQKAPDFSYKSNFLKSIIFQIKYPNKDSVMKNSEEIIKLLSNTYPNNHEVIENKFELKIENKTQVFQNIEAKPQGLSFNTKDGNRVLIISEDAITYTINGSSYINFKQFYNEINNELFSLFKTCGLTSINRVAIRKINLLEFSINETIKPVDSLGIIFNHNLVNSFLQMPGRNSIDKCISNVNLIEKEYRLNLTYGLVPIINNTQNLSAILDIDLFNVKENFLITELETELEIINQEIFNIFSWALQDAAKNQLNNGN